MIPTELVLGAVLDRKAGAPRLGTAALVLSNSVPPDESEYEFFDFDDGTVRVAGVLPGHLREALLLTHVEGGHDPQGRTIWYPEEVDDGRD